MKKAFTLIELLLSLLIAVLIVVLLSSLFATTARTVQGQAERAKGAPAALDAIDRIRDDLTRAIVPHDDAGCAVTLKKDPFSLSFCTLRPSPADGDLRWARARHVEYRTEPDEIGLRLIAIEQESVGAGSVTTNILIGAIDRFAIELYDGADWQDEWPVGEASAPPRAARIELSAARFKGQQEWKTEIFIPAGLVVTSSVVRASAAP